MNNNKVWQFFPSIESANEDGLLAIGGELNIETLLVAYSKGIFPWPIDNLLAWFSPDPRGVLQYSDLSISRSLKKVMRRNPYQIRFNHNFEAVIRNCAQAHTPTWITEEIVQSYLALFNAGHAYSVESYYDQQLVGGIYGVRIKHFVSAESMYYQMPNASKIALISLMEKLHQEGIDWIDTQMITPIIEKLGGKNISRHHFIEKLNQAFNSGR